VTFSGKVSVGWPYGASHVNFTSEGISYIVQVKNGVYSVTLPKGQFYSVCIEDSFFVFSGCSTAKHSPLNLQVANPPTEINLSA
jgi:hypothetical protein